MSFTFLFFLFICWNLLKAWLEKVLKIKVSYLRGDVWRGRSKVRCHRAVAVATQASSQHLMPPLSLM